MKAFLSAVNAENFTTRPLSSVYGRFSHWWSKDIVKWHAHVLRSHDRGGWCGDLLFHRNISFIDQLRSTFSYRGSSRINSRRRIGGVSQRWEQGFIAANPFCLENPLDIRRVSQIDNIAVTRTALLERLEATIREIDS